MEARLEIGEGVGEHDVLLLADDRSSGGLLMEISRKSLKARVRGFEVDGVTLKTAIGEVINTGKPGRIRMSP